MTSLRSKNALSTQVPCDSMEGTFRPLTSPLPHHKFSNPSNNVIQPSQSPTERRPSCPLSPGKAERIFIIEDAVKEAVNVVNVEPEEELQPKPFVRTDFLRRSFSLPDIADIENNVMMNHEINENRNQLRISFNPVEMVVNGHDHMAGTSQPQTRTAQTWFGGVFGCFRPIIGILGTKGFKDERTAWEIDYELLREMEYLGCGAQGSVYRALLNNEPVAVKKMREKCESEILHLRKLNHKNIVAFKGISSQLNNFCIVMEYCQYGQLCQYLKRCTTTGTFMKPFQVVDWSRQIASGMAYLHKHMIIHRDLKSPNVLIGNDYTLKISDFGISRQVNNYQSTKMSFAGTASWMAPEVIRMEPSSTKVDVWSYGVVLWELLTLEMPYSEFEQSTIIYGIGNNTLSLPLPESLPPGYKLLMQLCWKPKPKNRPSFFHILTHIEIACREINDMSADEFAEKQRIWKHDVKSRLSQARISFHNSNSNLDLSCHSRNSADSRIMKKQESEIQLQKEECEEKAKMLTTLYQNMISVMANMAERERELCRAEKVHFKRQLYQQGQMSSLLKQAVTDPVYKSALELSRQVSASTAHDSDRRQQSVDDIGLDEISKYLESPVKKSSFIQSGSVKQRLRRNRRAKSSHQAAMQANFSHEPSTSFGESLATDPSFDHDHVVVVVTDPSIELEDLSQAGVGVGSTVPMMRNIPNRRTFDSGYGDSQSAVSSPVAELKKNDAFRESFHSQVSRDSSAGPCKTRCRLRRQKAMDRGSAPSSANSRSRSGCTRGTARRPSMANSSTDYEDNDEDYDSLPYNNCHSMSMGRLEYVNHAYGRLRRKTSFNSSSSNDVQDDEDDECNTSSSNENLRFTCQKKTPPSLLEVDSFHKNASHQDLSPRVSS